MCGFHIPFEEQEAKLLDSVTAVKMAHFNAEILYCLLRLETDGFLHGLLRTCSFLERQLKLNAWVLRRFLKGILGINIFSL
jgi:hypothetical protein